jgi:hypothetical protein
MQSFNERCQERERGRERDQKHKRERECKAAPLGITFSESVVHILRDFQATLRFPQAALNFVDMVKSNDKGNLTGVKTLDSHEKAGTNFEQIGDIPVTDNFDASKFYERILCSDSEIERAVKYDCVSHKDGDIDLGNESRDTKGTPFFHFYHKNQAHLQLLTCMKRITSTLLCAAANNLFPKRQARVFKTLQFEFSRFKEIPFSQLGLTIAAVEADYFSRPNDLQIIANLLVRVALSETSGKAAEHTQLAFASVFNAVTMPAATQLR